MRKPIAQTGLHEILRTPNELIEIYRRIAKDPWEFAKTCVFTKDEVDKSVRIKPFPQDLLYLKTYFELWTQERLIAVPKSRRMFMTWSNVILYLHDTMFNVGKRNAFVSKKEDDSDDLVERAWFVYEHIPEQIIPRQYLPKAVRTFCRLEFPEIESAIEGFPSGADQLRQFTFSGILADEMAFWENAEEMYSAAFPTLEGGGRFTAISSPGPNFFKRLVHDTMDIGTNDETQE